jgi:hypothetical protein
MDKLYVPFTVSVAGCILVVVGAAIAGDGVGVGVGVLVREGVSVGCCLVGFGEGLEY